MAYQVVAIFKPDPANAAEEVRRAESTTAVLRERSGFISFDVMKPDEETVAVTQHGTSQHAFPDGMNGMREAAGQLPPPIVTIHETYSGEVAVSVH
ncbi:hypothetical protein ACWD9K_37300 [Streptomyces sp. 900116325]